MSIEDVKSKLEFGKVMNKIVNYSYSELGSELARNIPFITDKETLEYELDKVLEMEEILHIDGYFDLTGLKDVRNIMEKIKIEGNFVSSDKYLWILDLLRLSRTVKNYIKNIYREYQDRFTKLSDLCDNLFIDKVLEHNIEITVDVTGEVKDSASAELRKIRARINELSETLRKTLLKILKKISEKELAQDEIITLRDGRSVIPVKAENKRKVAGIIHSSSSSGATVFIEPGETIELNNEITELHFKEKREIEKILVELSRLIAKHYNEIRDNVKTLGELDFLQAKARYAVESISSKPMLSEGGMELINAFHPILIQTTERKNVVPLNIKIGYDYNTLVVTGPNAGGKTVSLKTIGLLQVMLQSGILIPAAANSTFRIFDKIFINIGDEQSIENNLSTFSSHLKSIKEIVESADSNSLVLIDEICAGTDPAFGSTLSASILKYLSSIDCFSVVTTHIGELKSFAYNTPKIENACLEFDTKSLSPVFKFITGIPGQSFTFEIARKFNFPENLLEYAETFLTNDENKLENLIKELSEAKQEYSELKSTGAIRKAQLENLITDYEQKSSELKQQEKEIIKDAKTEAAVTLKQANKLIESTIKKIRETKAENAKEIKSDFHKEAAALIHLEKEDDVEIIDAEEIIKGDAVKLKGTNTTGEIVEIKKNVYKVNANGMLFKLKRSELEKISRKKLKHSYGGESSVQLSTDVFSPRLDLRGMYTDEVEDIVEKFIYDGQFNGLIELVIVHGKGSGKLREKVRQLLSRIPSVKSFRYGNWNEGDTGVTIVNL